MRLQATIGGFNGKPVTMTGYLDPDTGILAIVDSRQMTPGRIEPDYGVVSNMNLAECDQRFSDAELKDAIRQFFIAKDQGLIVLSEQAKRFDPEGRIEMQAVDESGAKYSIASGVENTQVAVLALAYLAAKQRDIGGVMDCIDSMTNLYAIQTI